MNFAVGRMAVVLFMALSSSAWSSDDEDVKNARELAKALQEHMVSTYSCQKYLGGLGHYRAAKLFAVQTYGRLTDDRNQAVLTMDRIEQEIKASKIQERLESQFKEMKLSYVVSVGTCQDLISESLDKVELLQAKLKLL